MRFADAPSRTLSGTADTPHDPLFRTRRLLRRRAGRLTIKQRAKLLAALLAGDPNDEVSAAWLVAQDLMAAYANPDRAAGKAAAEMLITTAKPAPSPKSTVTGALSLHDAPNSLASITPASPTGRPNT